MSLLRLRSTLVPYQESEHSDSFRIGRVPGPSANHLVIDESSVSRVHAEIRLAPGCWLIRDLGSTNGTFLNGARLQADERLLGQWDGICFGSSSFIVADIHATANLRQLRNGVSEETLSCSEIDIADIAGIAQRQGVGRFMLPA